MREKLEHGFFRSASIAGNYQSPASSRPSLSEIWKFVLIQTRYRVFDPLDESDPPLLPLSGSVRIMLCCGPTPVTSETLDKYPSLECIVGTSAGYDHFDLAECRRRGIRVTGAGDSFSEDAADFAVGLLIDVLRRVSVADRFVRAGSWPVEGKFPLGSKIETFQKKKLGTIEPSAFRSATEAGKGVVGTGKMTLYLTCIFTQVGGKRVGIVGLGSIGSRIGKRLEAFGCSIAYTSKRMKPNVSFPFHSNIHDLEINSDVLILCCALTKYTHHIVGKEALTALGKEGIVINVGRGALIDEEELVQFLKRGEIGGAGLDVYENEPHVPKELFGLS
ncbi:hypothetical protein KY290_034791 [Solanum tuberosum]|uniref:D-isomer specific 2-hydroxyacid dehydrogenase NAD-binding domain-containing protein n=1 Tax=Solanum tuberosum TaxID=4113 RepID=A0ABQ7U4R7_SOLTU|nr:hypothetical protein KY289_034157 [Solanum tuberosum]KAH0741748.1 hypothetical protein KY290_034791 [Solanum tuberosum]